MYRRLTRLVCALLVACLLPVAVADARIVELGDLGGEFPPSCPASPCEVVSRTTAYQSQVGERDRLFIVPRDGRIVAWTITLGLPRKRQRVYFEETLGGPAQAGISVLKVGDRAYRRVLAHSPLVDLTPFFGRTVQFPLATSLPVTKGNIVALTVPTWAPALGLGLGRDSIWRASRAKDGCDDTQQQSAQTDIRDLTQYKCVYRTARLTYSVTLITTPVVPKD